ncbi:splicing factor U2AF 26 kDa subunit-like isoform X1 [Pocillopora damicornis]|uniref:splicing factor U2AF 26 kDa subunit-like isoform X1 n=1 Tax=Pocillopora damicornis TaxID=46731 RepID=UPI000F556793|nr:splicing factor U2AF 26 kDa subunit-like isoform X1 [Pocillopora damicornis]
MAEYLASIFGTEKDKVNCSFYFKIGACRHGERCSRLHNKPTFSQTILLQNMYQNPQSAAQVADGTSSAISDVEAQEHYDRFFEDVFLELEEKYGEIEEMNVCDNLGDHLVGNVYVKFRYEEDAEKAVNDLDNRWYNGQPIYAELSPVTDFREACCRQYEMGECSRGGFCNFMHMRPISGILRRELYGRNRRNRRKGAGGAGASGAPGGKETPPRSRSPSPPYTRRSRSRSPPRRRSRSPPRRDRSRSPPRRDRSPRDRDRRGRH